MRNLLTASLAAAWLLAPTGAVSAERTAKPNIIFFIADDLGYGDVGCYGQEKIRTPNVDRLATEGMRFTQAYSGNAVCAPSRCVLMTGKHPGHAFVRNNREVQPEGQWPLPADTFTLAMALKREGYTTGAFGKWGLGGPGSSGDPLKMGFDRFYGYNCQRVAHNYYPTYLWDNDRQVKLNNPDFAAHQKLPEDADPNSPKSYEPYRGKDYAPDLIAEQARRFVRDNRERPFFLFFPTTVPHLALQVPEDSLAEYAGQWPEEPYVGGRGYLPHPRPLSAYAAMVTRLDREIGSVVAEVQKLGLENQTMFVFTSDNGPVYDRLGGTDADFFKSAGPLRGRKGSLYEGGVRVPQIVRWKGHVPAGTTCERVTGFEDWLPTLLDVVGAAPAAATGLDGISFASSLFGKTQEPRPFLYREFPAYGGQQSIRVGDWKAIRTDLMPANAKKSASKPRQTELYNLAEDPAETVDLAKAHPEIISRLEAIMTREHTISTDFPFPVLDKGE